MQINSSTLSNRFMRHNTHCYTINIQDPLPQLNETTYSAMGKNSLQDQAQTRQLTNIHILKVTYLSFLSSFGPRARKTTISDY